MCAGETVADEVVDERWFASPYDPKVESAKRSSYDNGWNRGFHAGIACCLFTEAVAFIVLTYSLWLACWSTT